MVNVNFTPLAFNAEQSNRPATAGIVCPNCFGPLVRYNLYGPGDDGRGRTLRSYMGHCLVCQKSCEVLQFLSEFGVWPMLRWRLHDQVWRPWVTVQELPEPTAARPPAEQRDIDAARAAFETRYRDGRIPPVITGQGDYQHPYTPSLLPSLQKTEGLLKSLLNVIGEMIHLERDR